MNVTALIWDFDGTLVDSYEATGEALQATYAHYGLDFDEEWVMAFIIKESVQALLYQVAKEHHLDFAALSAFSKKSRRRVTIRLNLCHIWWRFWLLLRQKESTILSIRIRALR